jgi:hypothetical protein
MSDHVHRLWGCNRSGPLAHPWIPSIPDVACGYDCRLFDPRCAGCYRARAESPLDQLKALDARQTENGIAKS